MRISKLNPVGTKHFPNIQGLDDLVVPKEQKMALQVMSKGLSPQVRCTMRSLRARPPIPSRLQTFCLPETPSPDMVEETGTSQDLQGFLGHTVLGDTTSLKRWPCRPMETTGKSLSAGRFCTPCVIESRKGMVGWGPKVFGLTRS